MRGEWSTNSKGNKVLLDYDSLIATVFHKDDDTWGAIINGQLLVGSAVSAEDMMEHVQEVLLHPYKARYVPPKGTWLRSKAGGYYKRAHGTTISVKQAKTGSWFAASREGMLSVGGKARWFATAEEAMRFADTVD
jgi:hypothetical protein